MLLESTRPRKKAASSQESIWSRRRLHSTAFAAGAHAEFGHALHGMLSDVTYPSIAGTSVSTDFVELPSQLYEHWFEQPEILQPVAGQRVVGMAERDREVAPIPVPAGLRE